METSNLLEKIKNINGSVLVIGDSIIDRYLYCSSNSIAQEAPIPKLCVENSHSYVGGADNVVRFLKNFSVNTICATTIYLIKDLSINDISVKTRIVNSNKIVTRFDKDIHVKIDGELKDKIVRKISYLISTYNIRLIIISDYGKGIFGSWFQNINFDNIPIILDPHPTNIGLYLKMKKAFKRTKVAVTPNLNELALLGFGEESDKLFIGNDDRHKLIKLVMALYSFSDILLTMGDKGASYYNKDFCSYNNQANKLEVYDPCGAGDAVVGAFALYHMLHGQICKDNVDDLLEFVNLIGGISVSKVGAYMPTIQDLEKYCGT